MRITIDHAEALPRRIPLTLPYRIAGRSFDAADVILVVLRDASGETGLGCSSPVEELTGESPAAAAGALREAMLPSLAGADVSDLDAAVSRAAAAAPGARAALAALDIALHDLHARRRGVPLVSMLGGPRRRLITSITVGIDAPETMAAEARRRVGQGFRVVKVKIGEDVSLDAERLRRVRDAVGPGVRIRIDANEGYGPDEAIRLAREAGGLDVQLFEQPVRAGDLAGMSQVSAASAIPVVADEAVQVADQVAKLAAARAARGANIKLMKCGGILAARRLDAELARVGWSALVGCMDETRASIAAAAHFAAAAATVEWIDLDGHLDLAADPFTGGFDIVNGEIVLTDAPGLGIDLEGLG